ncbi:MAG: hypothetical protein ACI9AU_001264, partial [Bacteroidia bacterium]
MQDIENIELKYLTINDYKELKSTMQDSYSGMPGSLWSEENIATLVQLFPEGQVVIKINGEFAGCALSLIVDYDKFEDEHTYKDITGNFTFNTHTALGDVLYGIDIFIAPKYR